MEPEVCNLLRNGCTLQDLFELYGIHSVYGRTLTNLVSLKYDQIKSQEHFDKLLVRQCRSLILDTTDNYRVVSRSMDKFFNFGEKYAANLDPKTTKCFEKLDGSLITTYFYNGKWYPSTTGSVEASGGLPGLTFYSKSEWKPSIDSKFLPTPQTLSELFWQLIRMKTDFFDRDASTMPVEVTNLCFNFELCSPLNIVVLPHKEASITLLSARNRVTGNELWPNNASTILDNKVPVVKVYSFASIKDLPPFPTDGELLSEGFVFADGDEYISNRFKDKDPRYLLRHRMMSSNSIRSIVNTIRTGEEAEFLSYFPSRKEYFDQIKKKYFNFIELVRNEYDSIKHIQNQKDFAFAALKLTCPPALFEHKKGLSFEDYFRNNCHIDRLLKYLNLEENE